MGNATEFVCYWLNGDGTGLVVFNPWGDRTGSYSLHGDKHTAWAQEIHDNWVGRTLWKSAYFPEWSGKTVYLVGRSKSLLGQKEILKRRNGPAIFMNHGVLELEDCIREGDYVGAIDHEVCRMGIERISEKIGLITFPGMKHSFIADNEWADVRGFTFWNVAPMNDWMRRDFSNLPEACECISVSISMLHLAAISRPRRIVCCGMDFGSAEEENAATAYVGASGRKVWAHEHHARAANALTYFSRYVKTDGKIEVVNTSADGLFGVERLIEWPEGKEWAEMGTHPWITMESLESAVNEDRRTT